MKTQTTRTRRAEPVFYPGAGVVFRVVRDITEWEGRIVGRCRVGNGAEMMVQRAGTRWDILKGVSAQDVYNRQETAR